MNITPMAAAPKFNAHFKENDNLKQLIAISNISDRQSDAPHLADMFSQVGEGQEVEITSLDLENKKCTVHNNSNGKTEEIKNYGNLSIENVMRALVHGQQYMQQSRFFDLSNEDYTYQKLTNTNQHFDRSLYLDA